MALNASQYNIIVKVGEDTFLKYRRVTNLLRFTGWLDKQHSSWRWFNVYDAKTRTQVASYTKASKPARRYV